MIPVSIAKRTYIMTTVLFSMLMLIFVWFGTQTARDVVYREKERELLVIASFAEAQIPSDIEDILATSNIQNLSHQEKVNLLNSELQKVLAKVGKGYPNYGIGYGINNERLAVHPSRPEILTRPFSEAGLAAIERAYSTKNVQTFINGQNTLWDQPTLSVLYPHVIDDKVVWFTWANAKFDYLDTTVFSAIGQSCAIFFILWLGAMLTLRYIFQRLDSSLHRLAEQVTSRNDSPDILEGFPELEPLLNAVIALRKGLEEECAVKTRLNSELIQMNNQIEWLARLLELAHDAIIVRDMNNKILYWNDAATLYYGWSRCQAIGSTSHELLKTIFPQPIEGIKREIEKNGYWSGELIHSKRHGEKVIVQSSWTLVKDKLGNSECVIEINLNITDYKDAERKKQQAMERFTKAFHFNPLIMAIVSMTNWRIIDVNQAYLDVLERTYVEVVGKDAIEIGLWRDERQLAELRNLILTTNGRVRSFQAEIVTSEKQVRTVLLSTEAINLNDELCILAMFTDITLQKEMEREREAAMELFQKAFHGNPLMMGIVSMDNWQLVDVNQAYLSGIGRTRNEVIGKTPEQINLWRDSDKVWDMRELLKLNQGRIKNYEMDIVTKSNEIRTVLFSTEMIYVGDTRCSLGMFNDITDLKHYERELTRLDRLNIVGEMAAGIGHEVRNPMTTVRGYLQLLQRRVKYADDHEQFTIMIEELDRANSIITEFLSLTKNKQAELKSGNLNGTIHAIYPLLKADASRLGHELQADIGDIPVISYDDKEIRQLILNLVRNAMEAMKPGGLVTIKTYTKGDAVILAIKDNGSGIPSEIMNKLGTPFLTTKEGGTGLGLPVCYRIAERHNAKIMIDTSPAGTTFFVKFKVNVW